MNKLESLLRTGSARSAVWVGENTIAFVRVGDGGPRVWQLDLATGEERQRTFGNDRIWNIKGCPESGSILFCMDKGGARVAGAFGRNVPSPQPTTMPFSAAQMTASVYHRSAGTSVKGFSAVTAGSPAKR